MLAGAYVYQIGLWTYDGVRRSRRLARPPTRLTLPPAPQNIDDELTAIDEADRERMRLELATARLRASFGERSAADRAALIAQRDRADRLEREASERRRSDERSARIARVTSSSTLPQQSGTPTGRTRGPSATNAENLGGPGATPPPPRSGRPDPHAKLDRFSMLEID